jgi:flagellar hook assembly protein FlgD
LTTLARVAFALLIAATFAAFFVAQQLKSAPSFINRVDVVEHFSPVCECAKAVQVLRFRLKESDDVTVDVVDLADGRVARVATARAVKAFTPTTLRWRGVADDGRRAPDGRYRFRFTLRRLGRSIVYRKSFVLDTRPPRPRVLSTSVGGLTAPGQPVSLRISGANRDAVPTVNVLRTDDGQPRRIRSFQGQAGGRATWDGLDDDGHPAAPGTYLLQVSVPDSAGNVGVQPTQPLVPGKVLGVPGVVVRGIAVRAPAKAVPAGQLATFRVDARGRSYRWSIRRIGQPRARKHSDRRKTNTIIATRAPGGVSGVFVLDVRSGRYSAQVPFAVQSDKRAPLLVVLPTIRWLGTDQLDEKPRDGIPNTLANGSTVAYPREFAGEDGLPQGFADEVAPLLVMLDRARVRYDITTDVALSLGRDPQAADRPGVLFAGPSPWVSRPLAKRLRDYVQEGGRLALFGTGGLRGGVEVGSTRLTRPTPPGPADALGGRIADPREIDPGLQLGQLKDDTQTLRIFDGWDGFVGGFESVEELISPGEGAEVVAGIGQLLTEEEVLEAGTAGKDPRPEQPALSAVKQGKGYVFRIGIGGWAKRIAEGDADVVQITRNVVDLLRRVTPRPRSGLR